MHDIPFPFTLVFHERVASTSDEAKALAAAGAPHGTVVMAAEQTGGRGRLRRPWHSPRGNLYLSMVLRPPVPADRASDLGFVAAVAVAATIRARLPAEDAPALKWPNDVLVNGAKIAGILLESEVSGLTIRWVVLGIGVNVAQSPRDTSYPATSLRHCGGTASADELLPALLRNFDQWWTIWLREGFDRIRMEWTRQAFQSGDPMRVRLGDTVVAGDFAGLGEHGALLLTTPNGPRRITAGEVAFGADNPTSFPGGHA